MIQSLFKRWSEINRRPIQVQIQREQQQIDYDAAAELDRLETLKAEYLAISDAIDMELSDLEAEYQNATEKRRPAISKRRLTLYKQRAGNTSKLFQIDRNIEKIYNQVK